MTEQPAARPDREAGLRGDEENLYEQFAPLLETRLRGMIHGVGPDVREEACARTWLIFMRRQVEGPEVGREYLLSWLTTVARREAYDVLRERDEHVELDNAELTVPDPRRDLNARLELDEAVEIVQALPPRMRTMVSERVSGYSYEETAERTGRSVTNTNNWFVRTNDRLRELRAERATDERGQTVQREPALVKLLSQLEAAPPAYLKAELGPPPRVGRKTGRRAAQLAWRRGALAIERYRDQHNISDPEHALGPVPTEPGVLRLHRATVATVARARDAIRRDVPDLGVEPPDRELER